MPLPAIRADQDAFGSWYLQPTGVDPGDALGYFGSATPGERSALVRKGHVSLGFAEGDMSNPDEPLVVRPPTLDKCRWLLRALRERAPAERERLEELRAESLAASQDAGLVMEMRQIYRARVAALQAKIEETYRIRPPTATERKDMRAQVKRLRAIAADTNKLDDERREARDDANVIERQLELIEAARPYTAAGLRRYFLFAHRVQLENRIPKPHWEIQARLQQIAAIAEEEAELTIQAAQEEREILAGGEEGGNADGDS